MAAPLLCALSFRAIAQLSPILDRQVMACGRHHHHHHHRYCLSLRPSFFSIWHKRRWAALSVVDRRRRFGFGDPTHSPLTATSSSPAKETASSSCLFSASLSPSPPPDVSWLAKKLTGSLLLESCAPRIPDVHFPAEEYLVCLSQPFSTPPAPAWRGHHGARLFNDFAAHCGHYFCLNVQQSRSFAKLAKPRNWIRFWKIQRGDEVMIISGIDKGKTGTVLQCDSRRNQVKVKGCKLRKVVTANGKAIMIEKKLHYSNVLLLDPVYQIPTRTALRLTDEGLPIRIAKKSGAVIPWPEKQGPRLDFSEAVEGPKDTPPEIALEKTYDHKKDIEAIRLIRQTMAKYNRNLSE